MAEADPATNYIIKYHWEDCSISFYCPQCGRKNIADSQNGWEKCDCGLMYVLSAKIIFKQQEAA